MVGNRSGRYPPRTSMHPGHATESAASPTDPPPPYAHAVTAVTSKGVSQMAHVWRDFALSYVRLGDEPAHDLTGRQEHQALLLLPLRKSYEVRLRRVLELPPLPCRGTRRAGLAGGPGAAA